MTPTRPKRVNAALALAFIAMILIRLSVHYPPDTDLWKLRLNPLFSLEQGVVRYYSVVFNTPFLGMKFYPLKPTPVKPVDKVCC
jgi:hypothetical protein